jgi:hypothetical protein
MSNQVQVNNAVTTDPEFQTWLKGVLHDDNIKDLCVMFTKKDGTEREMQCTLVESRIPAEKQPKSQTSNSQTAGQGNDSAIRVFDTITQEWRSFRWDSIKSVNFTL